MATLTQKYLSELSGGKGFGEALSATSAKSFSKKRAREELASSFFGGPDIISSFIRGKIKGKSTESTDRSRESAAESDNILSQQSNTLLTVIAKSSIAMPGIARDINVLRQNLQQLVKLKGGESRQGADRFFLKSGERESALENERRSIEGKSGAMATTPNATSPSAKSSTTEPFDLTSLFTSFRKTLFLGLRAIFKPKFLVKIFKKVFLPVAIIGTLFTGIMDGWKKYQETGNLSEAIISGLGGMLNFLTFGLFGEDTLKTIWTSVSEFLNPLMEKIGSVFNGIKTFFVNMFGSDTGVKDSDVPNPKLSIPQPTIPSSNKQTSDTKKVTSSKTTSPTPTTKKESSAVPQPITNIPEGVEQIDENIFQFKDPVTGEKRANVINVNTQEGLNAIVYANQTGKSVSYIDKDPNLGYVKFSFDPISGKKKVIVEYGDMPPKTQPMPMKPSVEGSAEGSASVGSSSGGGGAPSGSVSGGGTPGGGSVSGGAGGASVGGGGASGPSSSDKITPKNQSPSGTNLSAASASVSDSQRMESSADDGGVHNTSKTTNSSGSTNMQDVEISSTYDEDLLTYMA